MSGLDLMARRHGRYLHWAGVFPGLAVPDLRRSRFCVAAALITGPTALGLLQRWQRWLEMLSRVRLFDRDALRHLQAISEILVECNIGRLADMLGCGRGMAFGTSGGARALAFDDAMVAFDQHIVENYLNTHRLASTVRRDIDRLLVACAGGLLAFVLGIDPALVAAVRAAKRAAGGRLTFFSLETRIAIGRHLVRQAHSLPP